MKRYQIDALAKAGVTVGKLEYIYGDKEFPKAPTSCYRVIEGPHSKAYITEVPRGWGGDGKFYLKPGPDSPFVYSSHKRQVDAVAEFLRSHY
jgi:hypothetical protein